MDKEEKKQLISQWEAQQHELFNQLKYQARPTQWPEDGIILTIDIQYVGNQAFVAADYCNRNGETEGVLLEKYEVQNPYISGYFAFREGPLVLQIIEKVQKNESLALVIVDGHGRAHPRKMGLACWVGIQSDLPTIGFAKRSLLKYEEEPEVEKDAVKAQKIKGETVGWIWRSRSGVKPVFVSPGHKMDAETALHITKALSGKYRIIEPIRRADRYARMFAKGEIEAGFHPIK